MSKIYFYNRKQCLLCDEALAIVRIMESLYDLDVEIRDIDSNEAWFEAFHLEIPVIEGAGKFLLGNAMSYDEIETFIKRL